MKWIQTVYAHCDIPCGVYDPHGAQIAAHTVLRMTQLITEAKLDSEAVKDRSKFVHQISRITHVKEEHGHTVEDELGTLENDYFKEEHFKAHPKLKELFGEAVKLSVKARQEISIEAAEDLLKTVQEIAEIFWKTKGYTSIKIPSPYPSGGEIVVPSKKV